MNCVIRIELIRELFPKYMKINASRSKGLFHLKQSLLITRRVKAQHNDSENSRIVF